MKGFLICTGKRAENHPLYIYETRTNIYSVEELCYYIYNNIETLDEKIFNEGMADFFNRCDMTGLAEYLSRMISDDTPASVEEVIRYIFSEVNYYDKAEIDEFCLKIRTLAKKPIEERLKAMGDALLKEERYALAEKKYRRLIDMGMNEKLSARFYGTVWYNLGVVYARMMYFSLAADCFGMAYKVCPEEEFKKALFTALIFLKDEAGLSKLRNTEPSCEAWEKELKLLEDEAYRELSKDGEVTELKKLHDAGKIPEYHEKVHALINKWKSEYRQHIR